MTLEPVNPVSLGAPRGYSNGMLAPAGARILFIAGQIAWDGDQKIVSNNFAEQFDQALGNVVAVVEEAGGAPTDIASLTLYVIDKQAYVAALQDVGQAYRARMGKHFPTMALVEVKGLLEPRAQVEIQGIAALV